MAEQVTAPSISMALDMKKNRIRIHKPTIHMLGDPILIQLLFDPEAMIVAIICPDREVPGGQEIRVNPKNLKGDNAVEFYSKMFLKKLRAVHGNLDDDHTRFARRKIPHEHNTKGRSRRRSEHQWMTPKLLS